MPFEIDELQALRDRHPAWGLLRYEHAPWVLALFSKVFVEPNRRSIAQPDLVEALEDHLLAVRSVRGQAAAPRSALEYLVEWATPERSFLRRFFPAESTEPHFDLTPASEQAVGWIHRLGDRPFVGTESRLRSLLDLVAQMALQVEPDAGKRIEHLTAQRDAIDAEIERLHRGSVPPLDDRLLREQFQHFASLARELLGDFRQVEENFRALDRSVRESIAGWTGAKGSLVGEILGLRGSIEESDQGQSFRSFWELLMSQSRQDQLNADLARVLDHPALGGVGVERGLRTIHYDWLDAGEHTQRTAASLSSQLRRFLDDASWIEDRRIVEILRSVEGHMLAMRDDAPTGVFTGIDLPWCDVALPFERPLFTPKAEVTIDDLLGAVAVDELDVDELFTQHFVDTARILQHIEAALLDLGQVSLRELCERMPVQNGLAEVVTYLQLGHDRFDVVVDDTVRDTVEWYSDGRSRSMSLPRVMFVA